MSDALRALQASAEKTGLRWALIYTNTWKLVSLHESEERARAAGPVLCGGPHSFVVVPVEEVGNYPVRLDTI